MTRHVVFGTGQVGRPLVERLVADGHDVVAVNRGGRDWLPGAQVLGEDATDPAFTTRVCDGAHAVYFCLNARNYGRWDAEFPPLQHAVLTGAARAGARLVVLENLYAYGPPNGRPLVETMSARPTSTKAATRAAMTREYLHTLYQFTDRWVVDDSSFRTALGVSATPLDEALDATLAWNRTTAPPTATRQETTS